MLNRSSTTGPTHYVTIRAAARQLGIGVRPLRRAVNAGLVPAYDLGTAWPRVTLPEVASWIRSTRIGHNRESLERA
jgi:hypothetical protein